MKGFFNLIGFCVNSNLSPGFVQPIFEKDLKYYRQVSEGNKITNFVPTEISDSIPFFTNSLTFPDKVRIGSPKIYAIKTGSTIFYGYISSSLHKCEL